MPYPIENEVHIPKMPESMEKKLKADAVEVPEAEIPAPGTENTAQTEVDVIDEHNQVTRDASPEEVTGNNFPEEQETQILSEGEVESMSKEDAAKKALKDWQLSLIDSGMTEQEARATITASLMSM